MGNRVFPFLAVTMSIVVTAVLVLVIARDDATERLETGDADAAAAPREGSTQRKGPPAGDLAQPAPGPVTPDQQPAQVEPLVELNGPETIDRRPSLADLEHLAEEIAILREQVAELEKGFLMSQLEIARLRAESAAARRFPETVPLPPVVMPPVEPGKIPECETFKSTGETVDNFPVYQPADNDYWCRIGLDTWRNPEVRRYRIRWSSGNWSPWFIPGIDDEDNKTNNDGTKRRIWCYFTDHEFQVDR